MSNFNTSGLLQALDRIKPDLKPLPQHFITCQDQHTRELYATLLAAVLLSDGQVSEPQSRLFGMLLQSMQLEPVPVRFFELAQQLDAGQLKQLIQALNHQDQQCALMIDALILARLDNPLGQAQADLLAELLDCFGLSTDLAGHLTAVAGMGLGLPVTFESLIQIERMRKFSPVSELVYPDFLMPLGVYVDSSTNLMWSRISIGQQWVNGSPQGQAEKRTWAAKSSECHTIRLAGFDDWRLPTKEELESLMITGEAGYHTPEGVLFPPNLSQSGDFGRYWSASLHSSFIDGAWHVCFLSGKLDGSHKSNTYHVRAVRGTTNVVKTETAVHTNEKKWTGQIQ